MPNFKQLHIDALHSANWFSPKELQHYLHHQASWLLESDSMTQRLKQHCNVLSVDLLCQYHLAGEKLTQAEKKLLGTEDCLVREVILLGDDIPWLCARSLLPASTLSGEEQDMKDLGTTPLGQRVFSVEGSYRDEISVAFVDMEQGQLLGRRSRLWIKDKPLLVSELFLPSAPIYFQEN